MMYLRIINTNNFKGPFQTRPKKLYDKKKTSKITHDSFQTQGHTLATLKTGLAIQNRLVYVSPFSVSENDYSGYDSDYSGYDSGYDYGYDSDYSGLAIKNRHALVSPFFVSGSDYLWPSLILCLCCL